MASCRRSVPSKKPHVDVETDREPEPAWSGLRVYVGGPQARMSCGSRDLRSQGTKASGATRTGPRSHGIQQSATAPTTPCTNRISRHRRSGSSRIQLRHERQGGGGGGGSHVREGSRILRIEGQISDQTLLQGGRVRS